MVWGSRFHWEGSCPCPRRVLGVPSMKPHETRWLRCVPKAVEIQVLGTGSRVWRMVPPQDVVSGRAAGGDKTTEDALKDAASLMAPSSRGNVSHCTGSRGFGAMWLCKAAQAQRSHQALPQPLLFPNHRKGLSITFHFTPSAPTSSGDAVKAFYVHPQPFTP